MASGPITPWQIDGAKMEIMTDFIFLGSRTTTNGDCSHEIKRHLLLGRKAITSLSSVQSLSLVWLFVTPWTAACQAALFIANQLPELAQIHVHWVGGAIQPSHPLLSSSPPAFNLSDHEGLFQWLSSLHQVAKILELQHQSFQWIFRTDLF